MITILIVLAGGAALLAMILIVLYNRLVRLRNMVREGWSGIDVQLKRRYDLIPNLVETAKGYIKHERETLEAVIQARNGAADKLERAASDPGDRRSGVRHSDRWAQEEMR